MKLAKKVLSVLLSVAMILSTVAVAASALYGDSETSKYQAEFKLTAEKVSYSFVKKSGAVTNYSASGDVQSGVISVQPGDIYRIAFYAKTNYNVGYTQGGIYYSAGLLDPKGQAMAAIQKNIATASLSQVAAFNMDNNQWLYSCVTAQGTANLTMGTSMGDAEKKTMFFDSVKDAEEKAYFDKDCLSKYNLVKWLAAPCIPSATEPGYTQMLGDAADDASWENGKVSTTELFFFTLQIPADAAAGSTYEVFIPVESRQDDNSGFMFMGHTADDINDTVVADDLTMEMCLLGDDQYIDLSKATLTFKVPGGNQISHDALATEVAKYASTTSFNIDNYKDGTDKEAFTNALSLAQAELTNKTAASQTVVDELTNALSTAAGKLELKDIDKSELKDLLDAADLCTLDDYKNDSNWTAFVNARKDGWDVYNNAELTTILDQGTVNTAKKTLSDAKEALVELELADYSALNTELDRYADLVEEHYTEESWGYVDTAYSAAQALSKTLKDTTANNTSISNAALALKNAIDGLKEEPANYADLQDAYDEFSVYSQDDYSSGWSDFNTALQAAKDLLDDSKDEKKMLYKKSQSVIDEALENLNDAEGNLVAFGLANYNYLQTAVDTKPTYYSEADNYYDNWEAYADALAEAEELLKDQTLTAKYQQTIDDACTALTGAYDNLSLKAADYTDVEAALTTLIPKSTDLAEYYTAESIKAMNDMLDDIDYTLKINDQAIVTGYVDLIEDAVELLELIPAYTKDLEDAIDKAEKINSAYYEEDSYDDLTTALTAAQDIMKAETLTKKDDQSRIDTAYSNLETALDNLEPLGADYNDLEDAIAAYDKLVEAYYTGLSWYAVKQIALQAKTVYATKETNPYSKENQSVVTEAATNLTNAIANDLVEKDADYTDLTNAIAAANSILDTTDEYYLYTDAYLKNITDALAIATAVPENLKAKDQNTIKEAADALNEVVDAVEYHLYDYSDLTDLTEEWEGLADKKDDYIKSTWDAVEEAYEALEWTYTYDPNEYGLAVAQDIAFENVYKKLALAQSATYTEVVKAEQAAAKLNKDDFTKGSWADLETALKNVNKNLNENHQDEVDAMAKAINDAIAGLQKLASYKDLDDKIAEVAEFYKDTNVENIYTQPTLDALELAYSDATTIRRDYTEDDQKKVDDIYDALNKAFSEMELKTADFTDLQAACDEYDDKVANKDTYTQKSWEAYTNAVLIGKAAIANKLDITKQNTVNGYCEDILTAKNGLTVKSITGKGVFEAPSGEVADISVANNFKFRVNARAHKLQFVDAKGNTWTYVRNDGRVSIDSYDDEGTLLEFDLGPDVSYEDWTITQWLPIGTYTVKVKYGNTWDEVNTQSIEVKAQIPANIQVYSCNLDNTTGTVGAVGVTVVTGTDIRAIQVVNPDGSTATTSVSTLEAGKLTFTVRAMFRTWGESSAKVRVFYAGVWHEVETLTYNAVK